MELQWLGPGLPNFGGAQLYSRLYRGGSIHGVGSGQIPQGQDAVDMHCGVFYCHHSQWVGIGILAVRSVEDDHGSRVGEKN